MNDPLQRITKEVCVFAMAHLSSPMRMKGIGRGWTMKIESTKGKWRLYAYLVGYVLLAYGRSRREKEDDDGDDSP